MVAEVLAGGPSLRLARGMIQAQLRDATEKYAEELERFEAVASGLEDEDFRRYMTFEIDRLKSIDDKAKTNLIGITVGLTVLFASQHLVGSKELKLAVGSHWGTGAFLLLIIGVVYMVRT